MTEETQNAALALYQSGLNLNLFFRARLGLLRAIFLLAFLLLREREGRENKARSRLDFHVRDCWPHLRCAAAASWGGSLVCAAFSIGFCIAMALADETAATCMLAASLFLRPWELIDNDLYLGLLPRLMLMICIGHLAMKYLVGHRQNGDAMQSFSWKGDATGLAIASLALWCFLSTLFALDPSASQSSFLDGFLKSLILYYLLVQLVQTERVLKVLIVTLVMSFLAVGGISIFQTFSIDQMMTQAGQFSQDLVPTGSDFRLVGFGAFANSNDIAALMVLILPFAGALFLRKREAKLNRVMGATLSAVSIGAVLLSRSRGALMAVAAIFAVWAVVKMGKRAWPALITVGAVFALMLAVSISSRSDTDLRNSSSGRMTYLKAGLRMGAKNPVFGVGFDAFGPNLQNYSTESLEEDPQMTAHNSWVLVFAETGVVGLALFMAAFWFSLKNAWSIRGKRPEFLLAIVGYGVAMTFLSHSYLIYPYLLYGLIGSACRLEARSLSIKEVKVVSEGINECVA